MFGHFVAEQVSQTYGTTQWSGDNVPTIADIFGNPSYSAVVHATYVISPTLLNETAFNYNGNRIHIIPDGLISAPSDFTFNRLFTGPNVDNRIPSINLNGVDRVSVHRQLDALEQQGGRLPTARRCLVDKGRSPVEVWLQLGAVQEDPGRFREHRGQFQLQRQVHQSQAARVVDLSCGYDYADFLLGYGQQYTEDAVKITGQWNNISLAAYVQDNWRVTPRLTVNLGLRWDGIPHTYEANQQSSNFYPGLYSAANAATFEFNTAPTPTPAPFAVRIPAFRSAQAGRVRG